MISRELILYALLIMIDQCLLVMFDSFPICVYVIVCMNCFFVVLVLMLFNVLNMAKGHNGNMQSSVFLQVCYVQCFNYIQPMIITSNVLYMKESELCGKHSNKLKMVKLMKNSTLTRQGYSQNFNIAKNIIFHLIRFCQLRKACCAVK